MFEPGNLLFITSEKIKLFKFFRTERNLIENHPPCSFNLEKDDWIIVVKQKRIADNHIALLLCKHGLIYARIGSKNYLTDNISYSPSK